MLTVKWLENLENTDEYETKAMITIISTIWRYPMWCNSFQSFSFLCIHILKIRNCNIVLRSFFLHGVIFRLRLKLQSSTKDSFLTLTLLPLKLSFHITMALSFSFPPKGYSLVILLVLYSIFCSPYILVDLVYLGRREIWNAYYGSKRVLQNTYSHKCHSFLICATPTLLPFPTFPINLSRFWVILLALSCHLSIFFSLFSYIKGSIPYSFGHCFFLLTSMSWKSHRIRDSAFFFTAAYWSTV